jgi:uncharacterized integral membrane protein
MMREGPPDEERDDEQQRGLERIQADQAHQRAQDRARRGRFVKVLIALVLIVVFIVFVTSNARETRVSFVFFKSDIALIWVMFGCAVVGGIVGYLIGKPGRQILREKKPKE